MTAANFRFFYFQIRSKVFVVLDSSKLIVNAKILAYREQIDPADMALIGLGDKEQLDPVRKGQLDSVWICARTKYHCWGRFAEDFLQDLRHCLTTGDWNLIGAFLVLSNDVNPQANFVYSAK